MKRPWFSSDEFGEVRRPHISTEGNSIKLDPVDVARRMGIPMRVQASGTGRIVLSETNARLLREYLELFGQQVEV